MKLNVNYNYSIYLKLNYCSIEIQNELSKNEKKILGGEKLLFLE